jgi:ABC-type uncharacterized transport system fused permease/ATPase subunit
VHLGTASIVEKFIVIGALCRYRRCSQLGITLVSISHQPDQVAKFHTRILTLTGKGGGWTLSAVVDAVSKGRKAGDRLHVPPLGTSKAQPQPVPVSPAQLMQKAMSARSLEYRSNATKDDTSGSFSASQSHTVSDATAPTGAPHPRKLLPTMPSLQRMMMVLRVLIDRDKGFGDTGLRLLCGNVALIAFQVVLSGKLLSSLPGRLQALVMQSDRTGYLRLSLAAMSLRLISVVSSLGHNWCSHTLAVHCKEALTRHVTERTMASMHFYTLKNVDKRIDDVDVRISIDVSQCVARYQWLVNSVFGPFINGIFVTLLLSKANMPLSAIGSLYGYALLGFGMVRFCAPDFAADVVRVSQVEGAFRRAHKRLIVNAETVALMGGEQMELEVLNRELGAVTEQGFRQCHRRVAFDSGSRFFLNRIPPLLTAWLRISWSLRSFGTDAQVMQFVVYNCTM